MDVVCIRQRHRQQCAAFETHSTGSDRNTRRLTTGWKSLPTNKLVGCAARNTHGIAGLLYFKKKNTCSIKIVALLASRPKTHTENVLLHMLYWIAVSDGVSEIYCSNKSLKSLLVREGFELDERGRATKLLATQPEAQIRLCVGESYDLLRTENAAAGCHWQHTVQTPSVASVELVSHKLHRTNTPGLPAQITYRIKALKEGRTHVSFECTHPRTKHALATRENYEVIVQPRRKRVLVLCRDGGAVGVAERYEFEEQTGLAQDKSGRRVLVPEMKTIFEHFDRLDLEHTDSQKPHGLDPFRFSIAHIVDDVTVKTVVWYSGNSACDRLNTFYNEAIQTYQKQ
jgi:predicted secreted protein